MRIMTDEDRRHIPGKITKEIDMFATNVLLKHSKYLFCEHTGKSKTYTAYCTHCKKEYQVINQKNTLRQNTKMKCKKCRSECIVKLTRYGRKKVYDSGYLVYYKKDAVDKNKIVAIGSLASRDYSGDYRNVVTGYRPVAFYIFGIGKGNVKKFEFGGTWERNKGYSYGYVERKAITSLYYKVVGYGMAAHAGYDSFAVCKSSIEKAVKNTPYENSRWQDFYETATYYGQEQNDLTEFFAMYSKWGCVEYLTKMKLDGLISDKMCGRQTLGAVNWRGRTAEKVLKLNLQNIKIITKNQLNLTFRMLRFLQMKQNNEIETKLSFYECINFLRDFRPALKYADPNQIKSYIDRFFERSKSVGLTYKRLWNYFVKQGAKSQITADALYSDWQDYLLDCVKLKRDMKSEMTILPKDLMKTHAKLTKMIKHEADEKLRKLMEDRYEKLHKQFDFRSDGYAIVIPSTQEDIIREGELLHHCVGGYAARHAEGKTTILFVRKIGKLETPLCTMEIKNGMMWQCRGYLPGSPNVNYEKLGDVKLISFVEKFKEKIVRRKSA